MTLEAQLRGLAAAAEAAREAGLDAQADAATAVMRRARERLGFRGDVYVLALAGGTGVGKSSILNALAGRTVSAVRAVRPTTDEPIAWAAADRREELAPLLEWMGVRHVAGHVDPALGAVAVLDLPDVDSVRTDHRARVDELLPRIDALAWVVDPEKYDDDRLHGYLRSLRDHAPRMRVILNKIDRVGESDRAVLTEDLRRRLVDDGLDPERVSVVSARDGDGIAELRRALAAEADAKAIVVGRLGTDVRRALLDLAAGLGVEPDGRWRPMVTEQRIEHAAEEAIAGALAVIDLAGVARQVQTAVLARARRSGGSVLGRAVALLAWLTGQQRRRADPAGYLRDWRHRGSLGRVLNPIRALQLDAVGAVPAPSRPGLLRLLGAESGESTVTRALDAVARELAPTLAIGRSWLWPVIGSLQLVVGAVFLFAVAWYVTLFLAPAGVPVTAVELPVLGPLPMPLLLLGGSVLASATLGWILSLHAGWLGRRRSARVEARVREAVTQAIESAGTAGLRRAEQLRRQVADVLSAE